MLLAKLQGVDVPKITPRDIDTRAHLVKIKEDAK